MMLPAEPSGTPSMGIRHFQYPEQDRKGWEALDADKQTLLEMMTGDRGELSAESDFLESILEQLHQWDLTAWPMYSIPRLNRWVSDKGRVVIIGDAAHSLIPAAGQGANSGVEDSWTLARVLTKVDEARADCLGEKLRQWQITRIDRIDKVQKLSLQMLNARLPPEEMAKKPKEEVFDVNGQTDDLKWLFKGVD